MFVTISSGVFLPKNRWTDSTDAFKVDAIVPVSMSLVLVACVCECVCVCVCVCVNACVSVCADGGDEGERKREMQK